MPLMGLLAVMQSNKILSFQFECDLQGKRPERFNHTLCCTMHKMLIYIGESGFVFTILCMFTDSRCLCPEGRSLICRKRTWRTIWTSPRSMDAPVTSSWTKKTSCYDFTAACLDSSRTSVGPIDGRSKPSDPSSEHIPQSGMNDLTLVLISASDHCFCCFVKNEGFL